MTGSKITNHTATKIKTALVCSVKLENDVSKITKAAADKSNPNIPENL
jgi:hypothetical protein